MISHISHTYSDPDGLQQALDAQDFRQAQATCSALLVQIYSAETNADALRDVLALLHRVLPQAVVVGSTSVGEIAGGRLLTYKTVIGFTFFTRSSVTAIACECQRGGEPTVAQDLTRRLEASAEKVKGVLLLTTPLSMETSTLLHHLEADDRDILFFGGGAGDYATLENSFIFHGEQFYRSGMIAVVFCGDDLHIASQDYLGWQPLSRPMRITSAQGTVVHTIEDKPAFDIYRHYLDLEDDEDFFVNALAFPLMIERDGDLLARAPARVLANGALAFAADIREGETFRLGFGDLDQITANVHQLHESVSQASPQAIFLYSCCVRRLLMQQDTDIETLPLQRIAPTFGFYTYGEYHGNRKLNARNATLVAVTLREGEEALSQNRDPQIGTKAEVSARDPFKKKQIVMAARLTRFIRGVTDELESAHAELKKLAVTDTLTQLCNRMRLDHMLKDCQGQAQRYAIPFSVILLDIDHFKSVNDGHGHLVGDDVLRQVAAILRDNTRNVDIAGRWGGEEFLVIVRNGRLEEARLLAEKLRQAIAGAHFPVVNSVTASLGVACFDPEESVSSLLDRADNALYAAKRGGRNQVVAQ
ncbi:diguanylate cyclase [Herbaspirillum huttiense]|uniref:sensor domain-containing diguanylate cyclase n=1 Tax=Herbaspirillum huttiense TaxID=863372 RepID=UPI003B3AE025